jgi:hypothetical protein
LALPGCLCFAALEKKGAGKNFQTRLGDEDLFCHVKKRKKGYICTELLLFQMDSGNDPL